VKYVLYRNMTSRFGGYTDGDKLWFDETVYDVADASGDPDEVIAAEPEPRALDGIFARHNRDDRPDGQRAPSLSVGDLIGLDWNEHGLRYFAVEPFGFRLIEDPVMLTQVVNADANPEAEVPGGSWSDAFDKVTRALYDA